MKAVLMTATGTPEVLVIREIPDPEITSPSQVKVALHAAGVNPVDTKLRSRGLFFPDALPAILGCDGAGVVTEIGEQVTKLSVGDEVWFCDGGLGREAGTYAELKVLDQSDARRKPDKSSLLQAAAGPLVLLTAWEALHDRARLREGQRVLIHAGAGGVGHVAIQLAKLAGAEVCTTVSTPSKARFVQEIGADRVIDYRTHDLVKEVMDWTGGRGADVAIDTVGGETFCRTLPAMAHYGDLVTILDPGPGVDWKEARTRNLRIGFELMLTPMLAGLPEARAHQGEILDRCASWIDQGRLRIEVSEVFPLAEAARAHALIEEGHVQGKLVLSVPS